jgi:uncharacterized protein (TIGR03435 family)
MKSLALLVLLTTSVSAILEIPQSPQFEVATVKPADRPEGVKAACHGIDSIIGPNDMRANVPLGRCRVTSGRLSHMIGVAYGVTMDMVHGGPDWVMAGGRFDVEAKAEDPARTTEQQLLEMLQRLLADRFKLKFHREPREVPGLALVVSRKGHKLEPAGSNKSPADGIRSADGKFSIRAVGSGDGKNETEAAIKGGGAGALISLTAHGASMDDLIRALRGFAHAPLINDTHLDGAYDFTLSFEGQESLSGPLQSQLGLNLESRKVVVDYFVVESADKPEM